MRRLAAALVGLGIAFGALSGCGLLGVAGAGEVTDNQVVWLVDASCPTVVVQSQGERFAVLVPPAELALRRGDVLLGGIRPGNVLLGFVPFPEDRSAGSFPFVVQAAGLTLPAAQEQWRATCVAPVTRPTR